MAAKKKNGQPRAKKGDPHAAYWTPERTEEFNIRQRQENAWLMAEELKSQAFMDHPKFAELHNQIHTEDRNRDPEHHNALLGQYGNLKSQIEKERSIPEGHFEEQALNKATDIANQFEEQGVKGPINFQTLRGNGRWNFDEVSLGKYVPTGGLAESISKPSKPHISAQQFPVFQQLSLFD
jgi:hypothetical protein